MAIGGMISAATIPPRGTPVCLIPKANALWEKGNHVMIALLPAGVEVAAQRPVNINMAIRMGKELENEVNRIAPPVASPPTTKTFFSPHVSTALPANKAVRIIPTLPPPPRMELRYQCLGK